MLLVACVSFQIYSINRNTNLKAMCLVYSSGKRPKVRIQMSEMSVLGPQERAGMETREAKLEQTLIGFGWQMIGLGVGGRVSGGGRGRKDWQRVRRDTSQCAVPVHAS